LNLHFLTEKKIEFLFSVFSIKKTENKKQTPPANTRLWAMAGRHIISGLEARLHLIDFLSLTSRKPPMPIGSVVSGQCGGKD
jgi:hypothetical protein